MGYDRGDSFPFDFEPNGIPFGSNSKGKLSPGSYPIQCERKWKYSFLSVECFFFSRTPCVIYTERYLILKTTIFLVKKLQLQRKIAILLN